MTKAEILERLYEISEETGKPIEEVVAAAIIILEREKEEREAEELILP